MKKLFQERPVYTDEMRADDAALAAELGLTPEEEEQSRWCESCRGAHFADECFSNGEG